MNLSTVKWAQWDKTQSGELLVCSYVCASHCAQLWRTILHRTDLIVFPLTLQKQQQWNGDLQHGMSRWLCISYTTLKTTSVIAFYCVIWHIIKCTIQWIQKKLLLESTYSVTTFHTTSNSLTYPVRNLILTTLTGYPGNSSEPEYPFRALSSIDKLKCGLMPNVMAALPNTGGAICLKPQSLANIHCWSTTQ